MSPRGDRVEHGGQGATFLRERVADLRRSRRPDLTGEDARALQFLEPLGATRPVPLVYDFHGFPERYYRTRYPSPGAPGLARRARGLLDAREIAWSDDEARGLAHGAYVPLVAMYPKADVPVLQVSMPALDPTELVALGRALAPLRDEDVLVFGSGFLTHNMRYAFRPGIPSWATEFDAWAADALARFDVDALEDFRRRAPAPELALPG